MMKLKFTILFLVTVAYSSFCQNVLIKTNGETLSCKRLKFKDGYVEVVREGKGKMKVSEDDIAGYYDELNYQTIFYKKPIVADNEENFDLFPDKRDRNKFNYLEREEVGKINLYKRIKATGSPGRMTPIGMTPSTMNTTVYYYAEKDGEYKNVFITGRSLREREKDLKVLIPFIADDPVLLRKVESDDFRLNEKRLLQTVREYNLNNFQKAAWDQDNKASNVSFYTRVRSNLKEKMTISVNDSLHLKLPVSALPLPVSLPNNVPSKVCINWEGGSYCSTLVSCPFAMHYYELDYSVSNKSFEIKKRTLNEFKNYMVSVLNK